MIKCVGHLAVYSNGVVLGYHYYSTVFLAPGQKHARTFNFRRDFHFTDLIANVFPHFLVSVKLPVLQMICIGEWKGNTGPCAETAVFQNNLSKAQLFMNPFSSVNMYSITSFYRLCFLRAFILFSSPSPPTIIIHMFHSPIIITSLVWSYFLTGFIALFGHKRLHNEKEN